MLLCLLHQTEFYLAADDPPTRLAGDEEEGELCIGGIGVALGYLHAPDLTAQRFISNPFGQGTIYRTGDAVKRLPVREMRIHSRMEWK